MSDSLVYLAGDSALRHVREKGLSPDDVTVVLGAAGGPKWIVLGGMDRFLFFDWFKGRRSPLFLLGSSIGSWRFSPVCRKKGRESLERFQESYLLQHYESKPTAAEVTAEGYRIMNDYMGDGGADILAHPQFRLSFISARGRGMLSSERKGPLLAGLAASATMNAFCRKSQGLFWERTLFYDRRDIPPFLGMNNFPTSRVPLTPANIKKGIMASGSIPLVMSGIGGIDGAPPGLYRDGGLIDYNMDVPVGLDGGIALFPHYARRVIPGWFDKHVTWRKPHREYMDRVLLVAPSPEFIARLPYGKIPDREDFMRFHANDGERLSYWRTVLAASERLAAEFADAVRSGRISQLVRPLFQRRN